MLEKQKFMAEKLQELHKNNKMFVIPNAWDVASAYIYEKQGFSAVATTSAGISYSLGYPDGEKISLEDLVYLTKKIFNRINIPLSVDFERGYSENIQNVKENAEKLVKAGAVGFNIEDGQTDGTLSSVELQIAKIRALCELKKELNVDFVINARTCAYWLNIGNEDTKLKTSIERCNEFKKAGADCIFVPGAIDKETIKKLVRNIDAPLNIILNNKFNDFKELNQIGVRRLSVGSGPVRYIYSKTIELAQNLYNGNTEEILVSCFSYAQANEYFNR